MARQRRGSVSAEVVVTSEMPACMLPTSQLKGPEAAPIRGGANKTLINLNRDKVSLVIADHLLFAELDHKQKEMLAESFFMRDYSKGDTVIRQGEEGNLFYVVEKGTLNVYIKPLNSISGHSKVKTYNEGDSFGELALMYNQPRAASVRVESGQCVLWAVERKTVQYIVQVTNNQRNTFIQESLQKVHLFKNLSQDNVSRLADSIQLSHFKKGDVIVQQGDDSQSLCVLVEGCASTIQDGSDDCLRAYMPGDFFGELALLTGGVRAATVKATQDAVVFIIDNETFERMLGPCTELLEERMDSLRAPSSMSVRAPSFMNVHDSESPANNNEEE
eukprot:CAMPEP_0179431986 /NCGR_PEP_ID=MMETSP0799-20121207/16737_1 /TAXON_ID=46947 /ORGANISM="Geminigera cryophila, Strain CCMP2564" /LENGTH=331 /DNA_ID=CAMNT_0021209187 /DNA_START=258 /DNA_END=1253 /DNA_ORIENTATION=-